jgi:hypothetical protein
VTHYGSHPFLIAAVAELGRRTSELAARYASADVQVEPPLTRQLQAMSAVVMVLVAVAATQMAATVSALTVHFNRPSAATRLAVIWANGGWYNKLWQAQVTHAINSQACYRRPKACISWSNVAGMETMSRFRSIAGNHRHMNYTNWAVQNTMATRCSASDPNQLRRHQHRGVWWFTDAITAKSRK